MFASVAADLLSRFGPFVVPVVLFVGGVVAYALLWWFYRWRDGSVLEESSVSEE